MGAVYFSIDIKLVEALKAVLPLDIFVETGTYLGDTIDMVKDIFGRIYSVELSEEYYNLSKNRFISYNHINISLDNSDKFLQKIQPKIKTNSVLYWLDAHWCVADKTAGDKSQCPLLEELEAIGTLNEQSIIIIDDARLFIAPPPEPHEITHWPDFDTLLKKFENLNSSHEIIILNDTIIFYPQSAHFTIKEYAYKNSINWLTVLDKSRDYDELLMQLKEKHSKIISLSESLVDKEKTLIALTNDLSDKEKEIYTLAENTIEKEEKITVLSSDLIEKEKKIAALSNNLIEKEKKITALSNNLIEKEKMINSLSKTLSIIRKRLSNPLWGFLTLIQYQLPKLWDFLYNLKTSYIAKKNKSKPQNKLGFFTPGLGKLNHYGPKNLIIPKSYFKKNLKGNVPKLSIVTPSFNQADFLEHTIKSVLDQGYPNLEYIIQDGNSIDNSINVIDKYKKQITYSESAKDKGQADAINKGFTRANGDIMAWINSDDLYLPGTFNYVINYFNKNPKVDVVYGHRVLIDENDKEIGRWILPQHDKKVIYWADFIPQETLFWRRGIWDRAGGKLNDNLQFVLDWDLILRFQEAGAVIKRLPRFLAAFRVHPAQKTSAQISSLGEQEMNAIREKYLSRHVTYAEVNKNIFYYLLRSEVFYKLYKLKLLSY